MKDIMLTVSDTAYAIALVRAEEAKRPEGERLFNDPIAPIFVAAGEHAREGVDRFMALPFFSENIRLRTRHIDDVVRDAIEKGARQLVLMGAGFDARAFRLAEVAEQGVRTFEVDFAALLQTKRDLLERAGVAVPASLRFVACDFMSAFEEALGGALLAHGFESARPTIFVCEGVLAYLSEEAIDRALRFMESMGGPGSRVVFDFSEYALGAGWALNRTRRAGFTAFEQVRFDELWRIHLPGEPPPQTETVNIGVAGK